MHGINRAEIKPGLKVWIVFKQGQRSGKLTQGMVKDILTKAPTHPNGIKVRLASGQVERVKKIEKNRVSLDIWVREVDSTSKCTT